MKKRDEIIRHLEESKDLLIGVIIPSGVEIKGGLGEILDLPKFEDVILYEDQKEFLRLLIAEIKKGKQIHLLFNGKAGTGKTYASKMIAVECNRPYLYLNGQMTQNKIRDMILKAKDNAIICVDEIHNLTEKVAETIYPAIEYNEISLDGKTITLKNNPIFIGTTTEPERLPKPLQDRFFRIEFKEPNKDMAKQILNKMGVENEAVEYLLKYTLNIRVLKKLVKMMDLYGEKSFSNLEKVFQIMKIDLNTGLSEEQQAYINYLKKVEKASLRNVSLVLGLSEERIKYDVEPELIKKGLINITSKGRELVSL